LSESQFCTSRLDHDDTLLAPPAPVVVVVVVVVTVGAVGAVSTEPLCDAAATCCDVDNLSPLAPVMYQPIKQ